MNGNKDLNPNVTTKKEGTNPNPAVDEPQQPPKKEKWWTRTKKKVADFAEEHPLVTAIIKWTGRTAVTGGAAYAGAKLAQRDFKKFYAPAYIPPQRNPIEIPDQGEVVDEPEETCEETTYDNE